MKKKLLFSKKHPSFYLKKKEKKVFNFFNLNSVFWFNTNKLQRKLVYDKRNINFPDGKILATYLRINQIRGPSFLKDFIKSKECSEKKNLIIGLDKKSKNFFLEVSGLKEAQTFFIDLPFIKEIEFSKEIRAALTKKIKKIKPDLVWMAIGGPKQEILANQLYKEYPANYFTVGAAFDFLLGKKKEAPKIFTSLGLEWFYRFITDFKYSKKKVANHFKALKYLKNVGVLND